MSKKLNLGMLSSPKFLRSSKLAKTSSEENGAYSRFFATAAVEAPRTKRRLPIEIKYEDNPAAQLREITKRLSPVKAKQEDKSLQPKKKQLKLLNVQQGLEETSSQSKKKQVKFVETKEDSKGDDLKLPKDEENELTRAKSRKKGLQVTFKEEDVAAKIEKQGKSKRNQAPVGVKVDAGIDVKKELESPTKDKKLKKNTPAPVAVKMESVESAEINSKTSISGDNEKTKKKATKQAASEGPPPVESVVPIEETKLQGKAKRQTDRTDETEDDEMQPKRKEKKLQSAKGDAAKEDNSKGATWSPQNWKQTLENIRTMRKDSTAPVDEMGCHKCADPKANPLVYRFQSLVALMLSSQTKAGFSHPVYWWAYKKNYVCFFFFFRIKLLMQPCNA